jgi:hypothetical protein
MHNLMNFVDINGKAAGSIMLGMREMAMVDGQEHPRELAWIALLEEDLTDPQPDAVEFDVLDTRDLQDAFLKSITLVALADGALKPEESALLHEYGSQLGRTEAEVATILHDVAIMMFSHFTNVTIFRDQAVQIGRNLGLSDEVINSVLDSDVS